MYDLCGFSFYFIWYQYKMTQYNSINVKLLDSEFYKLKFATENLTGIALRLTSNMNDISANEIKLR